MSEFLPPDFAEQMSKAFNQVRGVMEDAMAERFEYVLVPWGRVNELAREGWLMVPVAVPANIAGQITAEFVMSRKLGAADAAAEILRSQEG